MKRYKRWGAVMTAILLAGAAPGTSYAAVTVYDRPVSYDKYEYEDEYEDDDSSDSKFGGSQDASRGPGVVMDEEKAVQSGPSVKKVTLSERYHEEYKTYEESMGEVFFLYTNVENGGLTDQPVTIDIPANLTYTMEKDGAPWPYSAGQTMTEKGTYVLKLSGVENPELPLSSQTEYRSVFRFRIQDKPPAEKRDGEIPGTVGVNAAGETVLWGQIPEWTTPESLRQSGGSAVAESNPSNQSSAAEEGNPSDQNSASEESKPSDGDGVVEESDTSDEAGATDEPASTAGEDAGAGADGNDTDADSVAAASERRQSYSPASGLYLVTMENGKDLVSNVPEGYIGPGAVEVTVAETDAQAAVLYRNDELTEYIREGSLTEPGIYRLELEGCTYAFVIASQVNHMDYYPAPTGMRFTAAESGEVSLDLESDRYVKLDEDGVYTFHMEGEDGEKLEVSLTKDTKAPEFQVSLKGGKASVQYLSEDIGEIRLEKNGEPVEGFSGYVISQPGTYRLTVADQAGNESSAEFTLRYQVNAYGVAAVILVILVIAGIAAFVIHTKKTIRIR